MEGEDALAVARRDDNVLGCERRNKRQLWHVLPMAEGEPETVQRNKKEDRCIFSVSPNLILFLCCYFFAAATYLLGFQP